MVRFIQRLFIQVLLNISLKLVSIELRLMLDLGLLGSLKKRYRGVELMLLPLLKIVKQVRLGAHWLMQGTQLRASEHLGKR
jgi:hypothetical protein